MWRKIWFKLLVVFMIVFISIFIYFFSQHNITIWKDSVDKVIELEDYTIKIKEISIYNYTTKNDFYDKQFKLCKIIEKLPKDWRAPFLKISFFFNKPYKIDNKNLTIKLSCMIIMNNYIGHDYEIDNILKDLEISIIDEIGINYSSGRGSSHDSSSNVLFFDTRGENFPVNKMDNLMTIIIKDKKRNALHQFKIRPNYTKNTYNFF